MNKKNTIRIIILISISNIYIIHLSYEQRKKDKPHNCVQKNIRFFIKSRETIHAYQKKQGENESPLVFIPLQGIFMKEYIFTYLFLSFISFSQFSTNSLHIHAIVILVDDFL